MRLTDNKNIMKKESIIIKNGKGKSHWMHQLYPTVYNREGKPLKKEVKLTFQIK